MQEQISFLSTDDGQQLAYAYHAGDSPTIIFLSGFASNMSGTKALHLQQWCVARGQAYLRLDYRGHGQSSGEFEAGSIGLWSADALAVIEAVTQGPLLLVGSSMGSWVMLIAARELGERVHSMVGIASAPDFTEELIHARLDASQRAQLDRDGRLERASDYDQGPNVVTVRMIEDGRRFLQLQEIIPLECPVRLIHGLADAGVPWETSLRLSERLESSDVQVIFVKDGEHRLSTASDLTLLTHTIEGLLGD